MSEVLNLRLTIGKGVLYYGQCQWRNCIHNAAKLNVLAEILKLEGTSCSALGFLSCFWPVS